MHNAVVTAAIFAPNPSLFAPSNEVSGFKPQTLQETFPGEIIVSVDFTGTIKVIQNTPTHNLWNDQIMCELKGILYLISVIKILDFFKGYIYYFKF